MPFKGNKNYHILVTLQDRGSFFITTDWQNRKVRISCVISHLFQRLTSKIEMADFFPPTFPFEVPFWFWFWLITVYVNYRPQIATVLLLGENPVTSSDEAKRTGGNGSISAFIDSRA